MALKLDMSKAYNRVEWKFLEKVMKHLGFVNSLVNLIMPCLKLVSYFILLNGQPVGNLKPSKGLRQCDPISPQLFLLCAPWIAKFVEKR